MNAREAQMRMVLVEDHGQPWSVEQYLAWLLDLPDPDDVGRVATEEARRALGLAEGYYEQITQRVALLHPQMLAQVAFTQGATFAAAALGRQPFPAEVEQ